MALALGGVVAAVVAPSLAGTLSLEDRARALTTGVAAANAAVELGLGYPCGMASPSLSHEAPRLALRIADHPGTRGGVRHATVWYTPPHGGASRPLVHLATHVACP